MGSLLKLQINYIIKYCGCATVKKLCMLSIILQTKWVAQFIMLNALISKHINLYLSNLFFWRTQVMGESHTSRPFCGK